MKAEKNVKKYLKAIPAMLAVIMLVFAAACSPVKEKKAPGTAKTVTGVELVDSEVQEEIEEASDGVTAVAASSSKTITATLLPEGATGEVDWTVAWQNAESTWASGKAITDYVTVTPTADGALTATVTALQAFGEKVVITVTSRSNPQAQAQCVCDYATRRTIIVHAIESGRFPVMEYEIFRNTLGVGTVNTSTDYLSDGTVLLEFDFYNYFLEEMYAAGFPEGEFWQFVPEVTVTIDMRKKTITFPAEHFIDCFCVLPNEEELPNGLTLAKIKSSMAAAFNTVCDDLLRNDKPCAVFTGTYITKVGETVIDNRNYFIEIFFYY